MATLVFDPTHRLRQVAWIGLFVALFLLGRMLYAPLVHVLRQAGVPAAALEPVRLVLVLLATWTCTRLRGEPLASIGLRPGRRWLAEFVAGGLLGMLMMTAIVGLIVLAGGVRLQLEPARDAAILGHGAYLFLCVALYEEILFRGFLFQRLVDGAGVWIAQLTLAALFAFGHWGNPGMHGGSEWIASLDLALGAILLGLAWLRTRSLALPVGLHFGWNWMQGHVLGFGVSGFDYRGWFHPVFTGQPSWLTGGEFGPESSVVAMGVELLAIGLLGSWKGRPAAPASPSGASPPP
ncbi:MAG: CPBP family intramembrane metalloprotease [Xanthomonadales bacterium]|nr:CPBP family intramembrane metalloprotease [Xanthomonadales bacterium]